MKSQNDEVNTPLDKVKVNFSATDRALADGYEKEEEKQINETKDKGQS